MTRLVSLAIFSDVLTRCSTRRLFTSTRHTAIPLATASLAILLSGSACSVPDDPGVRPDQPGEAAPPDVHGGIAADVDLTVPIAQITSVVEIADGYHGVLVDKNHRIVELDARRVLDFQAELITLLEPSAQETDVTARALETHELTDSERILVQDVLISWMLEDEARAEKLGRLATMLRPHALGLAAADVTLFWKQHDALANFLFTELGISDHRVRKRPRGIEYLQQCAANGVPLPPDWGPSWVWQGDLPRAKNLLRFGRPTKVYTYEDPNVPGICMALPRMINGTIEALGIICQGKSGKACFWDNRRFPDGGKIRGPLDMEMKILEVQNGNELVENCTDCHRGENVFLIHPGTPLDRGTASQSDAWYTPISAQSTWVNPPPFLGRGQSTCAGCHAIPDLGGLFCMAVLGPAANMTMAPPPFPKPTGWGAAQADLLSMRQACCGNDTCGSFCGDGACNGGEDSCNCLADCPDDPNSCSACECDEPGGNCWCDAACATFGDCCGNKFNVCGT